MEGNICTKWTHKMLTTEQRRFFDSFKKKRKRSRNRTPESLSRKSSTSKIPTPQKSPSENMMSPQEPFDSGSR